MFSLPFHVSRIVKVINVLQEDRAFGLVLLPPTSFCNLHLNSLFINNVDGFLGLNVGVSLSYLICVHCSGGMVLIVVVWCVDPDLLRSFEGVVWLCYCTGFM